MMGFEKLREQLADVSLVEGKKSEPAECPKEAPPSSISSTISFLPSPSLDAGTNKERVLRSKWSLSTLGSVHDKHGHSRSRSASSRPRLYFGGGLVVRPKGHQRITPPYLVHPPNLPLHPNPPHPHPRCRRKRQRPLIRLHSVLL
jgi:hypothetical protein